MKKNIINIIKFTTNINVLLTTIIICLSFLTFLNYTHYSKNQLMFSSFIIGFNLALLIIRLISYILEKRSVKMDKEVFNMIENALKKEHERKN
jgi:hypothetical protein